MRYGTFLTYDQNTAQGMINRINVGHVIISNQTAKTAFSDIVTLHDEVKAAEQRAEENRVKAMDAERELAKVKAELADVKAKLSRVQACR